MIRLGFFIMFEFRNQDVQNLLSSITNLITTVLNSFNQWLFRMSWSRRSGPRPFEPTSRPPYPPYQQERQTPPKGDRPPYPHAPPPYQRPSGWRRSAAARPTYQSPPPGARPQRPDYGTPKEGYPPYNSSNRRSAPPPYYRSPVNGNGKPSQTPPPPPQPSGQKTEISSKRVGLPLFIAFLSFLAALVVTSFLDILAIVGIAISLVFSGAVFTGCYLGMNRKHLSEKASAVEQKQEKEEEEPVSSGNEEVDKLMREGKKFIKQMQEANVAIADEDISAQIDRLEAVTKKIFDYIVENPEKIPQIRKFMNYYLPTTLKLLRSYDRLCSQGVEGDNISATMHEIEGMMHTIVVAFEKQLDLLFQDEAMDIATDISVMESMLAQEGLTEDLEKQEEPKQKS